MPSFQSVRWQALETLSQALAQSWRRGSRLTVDTAFIDLAELSSNDSEASVAEAQVLTVEVR